MFQTYHLGIGQGYRYLVKKQGQTVHKTATERHTYKETNMHTVMHRYTNIENKKYTHNRGSRKKLFLLSGPTTKALLWSSYFFFSLRVGYVYIEERLIPFSIWVIGRENRPWAKGLNCLYVSLSLFYGQFVLDFLG